MSSNSQVFSSVLVADFSCDGGCLLSPDFSLFLPVLLVFFPFAARIAGFLLGVYWFPNGCFIFFVGLLFPVIRPLCSVSFGGWARACIAVSALVAAGGGGGARWGLRMSSLDWVLVADGGYLVRSALAVVCVSGLAVAGGGWGFGQLCSGVFLRRRAWLWSVAVSAWAAAAVNGGAGGGWLGATMTTRASRRNPICRFPSSELEEKFKLFCDRPVALELQLDVVSLGNHEVVGWLKRQEWENLAMIEANVNLTIVREFFCNITSIDYSTETITSFVCGKPITLTPLALGKIVNLTPLSEYFYPRDSRTVSPAIRDSIAYSLTGTSRNWEKNAILQGVSIVLIVFSICFFFCATVEPCSHTSSIHAYGGLALQLIGLGRKVDWCRIAFSEIAKFGSPRNPPTGKLLYGVVLSIFLTIICHRPGITGDQYKLSTEKRKPFNIHSISDAHASELSEDDTSVHVNNMAEGENSTTTDMLVDFQVDNWRL
ncbi:hypothetical protein RHGRI_005293 [Rhododendron griersonianum]|uniref:Putative plant transposon protein domain-containing protein n=1 Tax=Rhododendron griersonianum TaxID=479676 RepID=A0AAV6LCR8_9ERIC|nr:hypothetical protein RHGRI_005293 [Rhododendron griersonianum]